ncbi:SSU ribosomal protein S7E, partial [Giardia duodenalis]
VISIFFGLGFDQLIRKYVTKNYYENEPERPGSVSTNNFNLNFHLTRSIPLMTFPAQRKIRKPFEKLSDLEKQVAGTLLKLEDDPDLKEMDLGTLYISSVKEIAVDGDKKAAVVYVPYPMLQNFQKNSEALILKLEKNHSGHRFIIVANRTIMKNAYVFTGKKSIRRPRSRTMTSVYNCILDDICYPVHVIGKRTLYPAGSNPRLQVVLPKAMYNEVSERTKTYSAVYKALTERDTEFIFM